MSTPKLLASGAAVFLGNNDVKITTASIYAALAAEGYEN
jgi:hypothetical protein